MLRPSSTATARAPALIDRSPLTLDDPVPGPQGEPSLAPADLPPGYRVADGIKLPPDSLALLRAHHALHQRVRELVRQAPRRHRATRRQALTELAAESLDLLARQIEEMGVENVRWEVGL